MEKITSLAKRRGFIFPDSEIYGGLANSWDFGPLGAELKRNIKNRWWKKFVHERPDIVGLDAAVIMASEVWRRSGHLKNFTDPLIECKKCHERFRADNISPIAIKKSACPLCGGALTTARQFNLMFKTHSGPVEDTSTEVYLRPETAQAMFVNFEQVVSASRRKLPFGIAQTGKAFRNEITPGNFIFRTREFEQMEIEYFVRPEEWKKYFDHWLEEMKKWAADLGVRANKIKYREIPKKERAHYSERTVDIEYSWPFGQKELYGLAYRGDYDLKNHGQIYHDLETDQKLTPHVVEPSWGVERSMLVAMLEAYDEEQAPTAETDETDKRVVLRFPHWLAPYKIAVLPLLRKPDLIKTAQQIYDELRLDYICEYDETQSIGRRYRRQDEIGTPFCVTVDFDSLEDKKVTVRDRDTMKQERVAIKKLPALLTNKLKSVNV